MKKALMIFFAACIILFGAASCKKLVEAIFGGFDTTLPEVQVTIPAIISISPNEVLLASSTFYFNVDSIIRANTAGVFGVGAAKFITIKQISINIINADALNNLSNFESARITLQSNTNTTPTEFFSQTFPDSYASTFTYTPTNNAEFYPYLKGTSITYSVYGKMRRITTKPLNMLISATIGVK